MNATERAIAEADRFADLLEAAAKGLKRRRHQKHIAPARAQIKAVIRSFFGRQERALLEEIKPRIKRELMLHPVPVRESSVKGKTFANSLLPTSLRPLSFAANSSETGDYNEAITAAIQGAARTLAKELGADNSSLPDVAGGYLRDNSLSKLTGGLDSTSTERLQDALANAWDAGGDYDSMVKAIQSTFSDFSTSRAEMIARTESNDAYNYGRIETARGMGLDEKSWETESGDPCPICIDNESDGWIGFDENFSSGDDAPTAHPNCECSLNFRGGATDEDEG